MRVIRKSFGHFCQEDKRQEEGNCRIEEQHWWSGTSTKGKLEVLKGAGTPFSLIFVQFFSQKVTSIVLSPHNHGYNTLTGIYLPTLGLI